jgi:hypothetical protein
MTKNTHALLQTIEEMLGRPPQLPPLPRNLRPFPSQGSKPYLYGSPVALNGRPYLIQEDIEAFLTEAPDGYLVLGFWGYGINSYAFYYGSVTPWARIFLRLPYGGAYMGEGEKARLFGFFEHFSPFLERVRPLLSSLQVVESMGYSFRRFCLQSGRVLEETEPSLHAEPDQWALLWTRLSGSVDGVAEQRGSENQTREAGTPVAQKKPDFRSRMLEEQLDWRKNNLPELPEHGRWQGKPYAHILPAAKWTKNLWPGIAEVLPHYLDAEGVQAHQGKHNLLSSWALGANLYFPFGQDEEGRALLAGFLRQTVDARIRTVTELALEFVDEGELATEHLLGEKGGKRGASQTSPDVGVRVGLDGGGEGLVLIEVKFCETDFSSCSARKRELKPLAREGECDDLDHILAAPADRCAQHSCYGRHYFDYLAEPLKAAAEKSTLCSAALHGYQLFRQQALAEALANAGRYDLVASALAYHVGNSHLASCLGGIGLAHVDQWGSLFAGNAPFMAFTHQAWVQFVKDSPEAGRWQEWLGWVASRYNLPAPASPVS